MKKVYDFANVKFTINLKNIKENMHIKQFKNHLNLYDHLINNINY